MEDAATGEAAVSRSAMGKVAWRLLPLIAMSYLIAYMDRANVSFASVQMNLDLGVSAAVYGLGAGLFFAGYSLFEIPSNLLSVRFGARRWIARIMFTWGLISAGMMFVHTPLQFYLMRFALGAAEAGFFPGVMLYLADWFPNAWRGRAVSRFYAAAPAGTVVMGALAGLLLGLDGHLGLRGWQWLFLLEGLPAVAMAVALLVLLPDRPQVVRWLSGPEKAWIAGALAADVAPRGEGRHGLLRAMTDPVVLAVGVSVGLSFGCYQALLYSAPKLLMAVTGWSAGKVGWLTSLSGLLALAAMLTIGWHADLRRERYLHLAGVMAVCGLGFAVLALARGPLPTVVGYLICSSVAISIGMVGFCVVGDEIRPEARAVGFAAANTIGQVGSFLGPLLWGIAADRTGSFQLGLAVLPVITFAAVAIVLLRRRSVRKRTAGGVEQAPA